MQKPADMSTYEVPEADWESFCNRLTGTEAGKKVRVDVYGHGSGNGTGHCLARSRPLAGIVLGDDNRLRVALADPTQVIELEEPVTLRLEDEECDRGATLVIDAAAGQTLVVSLDEHVVPGVVEGF